MSNPIPVPGTSRAISTPPPPQPNSRVASPAISTTTPGSPAQDHFKAQTTRSQALRATPKFGNVPPPPAQRGWLKGLWAKTTGVLGRGLGGAAATLLAGTATAAGLVIIQVLAAPFTAGISLLTAVKTALLAAVIVPLAALGVLIWGTITGLKS